MGTSVGSEKLTYKQAILIAAVAEFAGSFFVGGTVSETIRQGVVDPKIFSLVRLRLVYGMIAALMASAVWLHLSTYLGWPVSTTHSIVGAFFWFGILSGGIEGINWSTVTSFFLGWIFLRLSIFGWGQTL